GGGDCPGLNAVIRAVVRKGVKEYGYEQGVILNSPGYLKVIVDKDLVKVEYIQTSIGNNRDNKKILYSYQLE
ncbi:MAG: hypothetical protein ACO21X_08525, partial [Sediminibacterium sp.]